MVYLDPIIDNQEHSLREAYRKQIQESEEVRIATGYFYLSGFNLYKDDLEQLADPEELGHSPIRILMGRETDRRTAEELEEGFNLREQIEEEMHKDIEQLNNAQMERLERLKDFIAQGLVNVRVSAPEGGMFHAKGAAFREPIAEAEEERQEDTEEDRREGAVIVGSSNFSQTGHTENIELNLSSKNPQRVNAFENWFDNQWANSQEFSKELIEIIESNEQYQKWKEEQPEGGESPEEELDIGTFIEPFEFYKLLAYDVLDGNVSERYDSPLYHFQHRGYESAKAKLAKYQGCIISDSVGLGKSFIGAELLRDYRQLNQNCLLIVPAHLTGQWENLLEESTDEKGDPYFNLEVDGEHLRVMSITKFQNLDPKEVEKLSEQFNTVLIDEAHRFRNSGHWPPEETEEPKGTRRYANMRVLMGGDDKHLIMLTATPLNNSAEDLKNLINLFTGENELYNLAGLDFDAFDDYIDLAKKRKKMIKEEEATPEDIEEVVTQLKKKAEVISDILDEVMVLRTRKHVKDQIKEEDDIEMNFNPPTVHKKRYDLPAAYEPAYEVLPEVMNALHLPHITVRNPQGGGTLKALYKLNLLKRLESSPKAFLESLKTLYDSETLLLQTLNQLPEDENLRELQDLGEEENKTLEDFTQNEQAAEELNQALEDLGFDETIVRQGEEITDDLEKASVGDVKHFIAEDLAFLAKFVSMFISGIAPENKAVNDAKHEIDNWLREQGFDTIPDVEATEYDQAIYPEKNLDDAVDDLSGFYTTVLDIESFKDTKADMLANVLSSIEGKAVIFTQYKATADYIYDILVDHPESPLNSSNSAKVKGGDKNKQRVVKQFSPGEEDIQSTIGEEATEIDYVVATDTLSEGVNLQDVNTAINYDLPWNPMRIVQRVGRIDRIGTTADKHVYNFFPDEDIEAAIKLLERLQAKIDDIALIVGKENNILDPDENEVLDRAGVEREKNIGELQREEIEKTIKEARETEDVNELDDTSRNILLRGAGKGSEKEAFERVRLKKDLREEHGLSEDDFEFAEEFFNTDPADRELVYTQLPEESIPEARVLGLMHLWHEGTAAPLHRTDRDIYYTHTGSRDTETLNSVRQIDITKDTASQPPQSLSDEEKEDLQTIQDEVEARTASAKKTQRKAAYKQGGKKSVIQDQLISYLRDRILPEVSDTERVEEILNRIKQPNLRNTDEDRILRETLLPSEDDSLTDWETDELLKTVEEFLDEYIEESTDFQTKLAKKSEVQGDIQGWAFVR
ncbi:MAG: helicase-related protein [Candidatus Nanohaloarchaea archaeon]